jgi:hypothetical protein
VLPFEQDSGLGLREVGGQPGPAHFIEQWTDGILREIMVLVLDACLKALATGQPGLSVALLQAAWGDIKRAKVVNFLEYLRGQTGGAHG